MGCALDVAVEQYLQVQSDSKFNQQVKRLRSSGNWYKIFNLVDKAGVLTPSLIVVLFRHARIHTFFWSSGHMVSS